MKIRKKLPLDVAAVLALVVVAALLGIYRLNAVVDTFTGEVQAHADNERQAALMGSRFKTQVQEWKNTLLRGKEPKQLDRYWRAFGKLEAEIQELGPIWPGACKRGRPKNWCRSSAPRMRRWAASTGSLSSSSKRRALTRRWATRRCRAWTARPHA